MDTTAPASPPGDLTDNMVANSWWHDNDLVAAGIPIVDRPLVTIGGGIGSFSLANFQRVAGVPTSDIAVLSAIDTPWQTYKYLTEVSQIPGSERLRSDSGSCAGNLWGFPAYAIREAVAERTVAPMWNVLTEPLLTDYWTPKADQVFAEMQREADRIGWWNMVHKGQVRMVRRRVGGGYFTILTPPPGASATRRVAFRSQWVHVAVGYPGLRFLPDLQAYREHTGDRRRVVNAYEPHEHIYQTLRSRPGVVVVRGGGIVASRVLQRLIDDRGNFGAQTRIVHLFRTYVDKSHGPHPWMRRKGSDGWAYQGFNWPKGAWGGQLRYRLEAAEGEQRRKLFEVMGGTNTPSRKLWKDQLARGRAEGFYSVVVGTVAEVHPDESADVVRTTITTRESRRIEVAADFVIDCTGLEADIAEHRLLADLLEHGGAGRNVLGRLDVDRTFEMRGTRSEPGRVYASGSITLGGYYAGVDSFLGLQYAALRISDDLAAQGLGRRIGVARSVSQWMRWMTNRPLP